MLHNLLTTLDKTREVDIGEAALYALLGFSIVFLGIAFLILVVWLVGKIMGQLNARAVKKAETVTPVNVSKNEDEDELTEETVAVITAALMAFYQSNNLSCEFKVKRIKRI